MSSKKKIIIPVVAAVLLIAAALIVIFVIKPFEKKPAVIEKRVSTGDMAYISGNTLYYIEDINKGKDSAVKIKDIEIEEDLSYKSEALVLDDEKGYIYFFDYIKDRGKGALCRIATGIISDDEAANEANIEIVDYDIYMTSAKAYTKGVLYVKTDDRLFYYDGVNEPDSIAREVFRYEIFENLDRITLTDMSGNLWIEELSTGKTVANIDTMVNNVHCWNPTFLVYDKELDYRSSKEAYEDNSNGHVKLYTASENGEVVELSDNCAKVFAVHEDKNTITYMQANRYTVSLYDCVEDIDSENMEEPDAGNYLTAASIDDANKILGTNYSSSSELISAEGLDEYNYGLRKFYTVEDDEKCMAYDSTTEEWYFFDIYKFFEDDSNYYSALYEKDRIDQIRDELKEKNVSVLNYSICLYKNGKSNIIADAIEELSLTGNHAFTYTKKYINEVKEKTNIAQITDAASFYYETEYSMLDNDDEAEDGVEYLCTLDGEETVAADVLPNYDDIINLSYNTADKTLVIGSLVEDGTKNRLVSYRVKDNIFTENEILSENGYLWGVMDGRFYYLDNLAEGKGDLYSYVGGVKTLLAKGIMYASGWTIMPEDGTIWGVSARNEENGRFDLSIYDAEGIKSNICSDIEGYSWVGDNRLFYYADGNVYYYHDGSSEMLIEDVLAFAYQFDSDIAVI